MLEPISQFAKEFLEASKDKEIRVISHNDTDGITSAAILTKTLTRLDKKFSIKIIKSLEKEFIEEELKKNHNKTILFLDLGSGSLESFSEIKNKVFILDHHEINKKILERVNQHNLLRIINPHLHENEEICGAGLSYLFSKAISEENKDLSKLAIIGMIGDRHEAEISKLNQIIVNDTKDLTIKKGPLIFSATRPLRRSLEYSTSCYIPGVTGSSEGVLDLLREIGVSPQRTLAELNQDELSKLVTAVMVRRAASPQKDEFIGNIYLLKFFNKLEDVREISSVVNACSRLGHSDVAISFCLGSPKAKIQSQEIYIKYKQELISGLRTVEKIEKTQGKGFVIMNAKDEVKDTIIGTITSMLSSSLNYERGTVLIGMAYNKDKIKVSARIVGEQEKNLKEILEKAVLNLEAEVGGHQKAAGCLIKKEDENSFLIELKKNLEIEVVKIN
jgi:single-stranded-DNA-specific exonuclease